MYHILSYKGSNGITFQIPYPRGLDKQTKNISIKLKIFSYQSFLTHILEA